MRKDPVPYPARPPLTLLANRENSFLRMPKTKTVFCPSQLASFAVTTLDLYDSSPLQL